MCGNPFQNCKCAKLLYNSRENYIFDAQSIGLKGEIWKEKKKSGKKWKYRDYISSMCIIYQVWECMNTEMFWNPKHTNKKRCVIFFNKTKIYITNFLK